MLSEDRKLINKQRSWRMVMLHGEFRIISLCFTESCIDESQQLFEGSCLVRTMIVTLERGETNKGQIISHHVVSASFSHSGLF